MVSPSRDMIRSSDDWTWNELKTERKGRKGGQNNQELDWSEQDDLTVDTRRWVATALQRSR